MRPSLKYEKIPQLDAWGILVFLFILEFIAYFVFYVIREIFSPSFPVDYLDFSAKIFTYIVIFIFCMSLFGKLYIQDFIPTRKEILQLGIAIVIIFWIFGLFIGPERLHNPGHEIIKQFPTFFYLASLFTTIVIAPFFEEAIFRRYFLEIQRQYFSTATSVIITAGVACLFHIDSSTNLIPILIWTFFIQVLFGILYVHGRLVGAALAHSFVNGLVMVLSR